MPTVLVLGASRGIGLEFAGIAWQLDGERLGVAVADSVAGMRRVLADRGAYPGGAFLGWCGQPIPW